MEPCGSMDSGVTTDGMSARSVPAASSTPPASGPVTGPAPRQAAKRSEIRVMRSPIHSIPYDSEREGLPRLCEGSPAAQVTLGHESVELR
jgi:hypothetical protein